MATTSRDEEAADDLLAAALAYAAAGLRVFPLKPHSKVPATVDGFKSATTDAEQVRDWWARWPDANVAIATGAESGIVALDVDAQHGGAGTLAELEREHGKMPRPHTLTGGGGNHYLFAHPGGVVRNSAGTLGHGLDVRGDGGYIVAPPSVHENGRRYVELRPFAKREPMPGWLVEDATKRNGSTPPVVGTIRNGERNTTLTSLAGTMRRRGMSEEAILAALRATPCETPLPVAELATIARSVSRYSPSVAVAAIAWERLSRVELRSIVFIDKPLWQADAFHLVAGRKGQGKGTLLALHAAAVTRGEFGSNPNVVWIASEDSAAIDIGPRLLVAGADLERVLIVKRGWIQLPRDLDEIRQAVTELGEVGLVVIDPLSNHIAGKNSDSEEVREAIGPLNQLADDHRCMVVGVRHLSEKECKNGILAAILGSSAWVQVPRAVLAVVQDDEDLQLRHVRCVIGNRLPPDTPGRMFRIEGVLPDGFENEVTRATWAGDSHKDLDALLAGGRKEPTKSDNARELILDILENEGEQESDALDARVASETGLAARTARDVRMTLGTEGLVKALPDKDEFGAIVCWKVARSGAPRP